ncbi:NADPH-dependent FMN reductase [Bdellovibrio sp. NC01]|uniref:NADPH-dependent FMN reductase n=1 Tax=Bdellovibrio sp. NC01 TaxID=2220073 RepID=UPI00115844FC|nr:NAD(P)H-dependent oxidoreductase [Bdellovibrio sp. NC01]QDK37995.1 flavoprotein [Bdellovibrio sp. NC01]
MYKILAICGSTRKQSSNLHVISAFSKVAANIFTTEVFSEIADLPHFNPDLDTEDPPKEISRFREKLRAADAILISTPEYALGVPGTLKNAIDWTVSSMEFSQKPVALITAGTAGEKAHASLLGTLLIIESRMTEQTQLVVSAVKSKMNGDTFTDNKTEIKIQELIESLKQLIENKSMTLLPRPTIMGN